MRIPELVAGVLVARQAVSLLPSSFCSPECPSCKADVADFDGATTSCTANSSFIQNCGHCQSCVMTYAIENGGIDSQAQVEQVLVNILNLCENTSVSTEIAALQSQASLMSVLGKELATTTDPALASMTSSISITPAPSTTATAMPSWVTDDSSNTSWESILSTATWASYYYAHKSAESASLASISSVLAKQTAAATADSTPKPTAAPTSTPLNSTWVAGPVAGSVLGMSTVFIVIFFTRRKHQQQQKKKHTEPEMPPAKEFHDDNDSNHSEQQKPQLHSDSLPAMELENIEVHELPVNEPVGSELNTPMEARMREEDWPVSPLPLSPLPLLFAMSELRDERTGNVSPKHDTFYHP